MPLEIQTVAGAGQFTGLAGAGLVTFAEANGNRDTRYKAQIKSASYDAGGAQHQITMTLEQVAGVPTARQVLRNVLLQNNQYISCFDVPRDGLISFEFLAVTVGKAADGTLIVDWEIPTP